MSKMAGGFGACLPSSLSFLSSGKGLCSIMICWFVFVPAGVPVLVSLLRSSFFSQEKVFCFIMDFLVPLGSGWGSGACLPSSLSFLSSGKGLCSIMICWFVLVPAGVRVLVSLLLSSFFSQEKVFCFIMDFLVPLGSGWGSGACLPSSLSFLSSGKGLCSIMICWFVLVPAGFRCLSPFFSLLSFLRKRCFVSSWIFWFLLVPAGVPVLVSLLLSPFSPQERGSVPS